MFFHPLQLLIKVVSLRDWESKDFFICDIIYLLPSTFQFTENPECVVSFDQMESSAPDILRTLKMCINQLEDVYLEVRVRTTNNTIPFFFYNFFRYQLSIWWPYGNRTIYSMKLIIGCQIHYNAQRLGSSGIEVSALFEFFQPEKITKSVLNFSLVS